VPFWSRKPIGTYVRPTTDWFIHQRARCSIETEELSTDYIQAFGLFNNSTTGQFLHVIGMIGNFGDQPPSINVAAFGRYIAGSTPPNPDGDAYQTATGPLYASDPMPPGIGFYGEAEDPTFVEVTMLTLNLLVQGWYPPWDIAVIPPNWEWEFYGQEVGYYDDLVVMFDYYWSPD